MRNAIKIIGKILIGALTFAAGMVLMPAILVGMVLYHAVRFVADREYRERHIGSGWSKFDNPNYFKK